MDIKGAEDILFWNLGPDELRFIRQSGNYITLTPGLKIFKKGDPADGIYVVVSGEVDILDEEEGSEPTLLNTMASGDVIGEIASMTNYPRTASAVAKTTGILFKINQDFIQGLVKNRPEIATQILTNVITIMADRIVRLSKQIKG